VNTRILAQEALPTTTKLNGRDARAMTLYQKRGDEIRQIGTDTFKVPSCSGKHAYTVRYGGNVESCSCPDRHAPCKHLICVGIAHAARRSGIREIRIPTVISGDPFAYRAKKSCHCLGLGYHYITTEEDGEEHDEVVPCKRCSQEGR
jgi:hypothetical protein